MEFKPFDTGEIDKLREQYAAEAKARWGGSDAYRESEARESKRSKADQAQVFAQSGEIFAAFAGLVGTTPANAEVQSLVQRWQAFITANYYDCTNEILAGLGQMYVADVRFTQNIDRYGAGTAELMSQAIAIYCGAKS